MCEQALRKGIVSDEKTLRLVLAFTLFDLIFSHSNTNSIFFEKLRLVEGREKSEERLRNEALYPFGFSTKKTTKKSEAQIPSYDLLHEGAARCDDSCGEMDF